MLNETCLFQPIHTEVVPIIEEAVLLVLVLLHLQPAAQSLQYRPTLFHLIETVVPLITHHPPSIPLIEPHQVIDHRLHHPHHRPHLRHLHLYPHLHLHITHHRLI